MALKFIPSLNVEDIVPRGSNSLRSKDRFRESVHYERYFQFLKSNGKYSDFSFFDSRFSDVNYGKLNVNNELVDVIPDSVKDIVGTNNVYVLPFVSDAFFVLKRLCSSYGRSDVFTDKIFINIEAKSGFKNLNVFYQEYMTSIYNSFVKYKSLKKDKTLYNFNIFLKDFTLFLKYVCDKSPFLRSSFFGSVNCDVSYTGLSIEIDSIKKDIDEQKYLKYFTSPDFNKFALLCEAHGFSIDKHCPWRLIFNLNNPNSSKYLQMYNLDKNSVFTTMFERTVDFDFDNLISYMVIFYNTYVAFLNENDTSVFIDQIDVNFAKNQFSQNFWYELYFYILFLEAKIDLNQNQYKQYVKNLSYLVLNYNLDKAYNEFFKILNLHTQNNSKNFTFVLPTT